MAPDARNPEVDASESGEKRSLLASLNTLDIKPDVPKKQRKKRVRGQPWPVSDSRVIEYIPARNWRRRPRKAVSIDTEVAKSSPIGDDVDFGRSSKIAAEKFNESPRSVQSAVTVVNHAIPELVVEPMNGGGR